MKKSLNVANNLSDILTQKIIPNLASRESAKMILARRPLRRPVGIISREISAPSLKIDGKRSGWIVGQNEQESMHAIQVPYLCYVVEGEIDMRLGIPSRHGRSRGVVNSYEILTLSANSFLLIPPGVFFPGNGVHWERPTSQPADSLLFWLHILPTGALCHTCTTKKGIHTTENFDLFLPDTQLASLAELLTNELQSSDSDVVLAASSALLLLMCHVRRSLDGVASAGQGKAKEVQKLSATQDVATSDAPSVANSAIIEKACDYIQKALPHDVDQIANHVFVSPSHLAKLFRIHLKTTVMTYVLEKRMEVARSFLLNTDMAIQEIASFTGYSQAPQFSRAFKQIHHRTPKEFREKRNHPEK